MTRLERTAVSKGNSEYAKLSHLWGAETILERLAYFSPDGDEVEEEDQWVNVRDADGYCLLQPLPRLYATLTITLGRAGKTKAKAKKLEASASAYDKDVALQAHGSGRLRDDLHRNARSMLVKVFGDTVPEVPEEGDRGASRKSGMCLREDCALAHRLWEGDKSCGL